jgi:ABC-2 type transport system ATP-binding protein/lipopolysaccharide transport system ATP-binding protein
MDLEATGYDNIELRGLFLGMSRRQIREKFDEIAEFTELGNFLDLPIRTYSAGMRMRLAFAISTSIDPDILLVDEGISAGDAAFLEKANQRLSEFTSKAAIIVLSSHSEFLVKRMCEKAVLMERGRIRAVGETDEILKLYAKRK